MLFKWNPTIYNLWDCFFFFTQHSSLDIFSSCCLLPNGFNIWISMPKQDIVYFYLFFKITWILKNASSIACFFSFNNVFEITFANVCVCGHSSSQYGFITVLIQSIIDGYLDCVQVLFFIFLVLWIMLLWIFLSVTLGAKVQDFF